MSGKIKAIIKRPDEKVGHMTNISASLKNLQKTVDGPIEVVRCDGLMIICNEEGLLRGLEPNFKMSFNRGGFHHFDIICGTVIVAGEDGSEFGDIPIGLADWRYYLKDWGNEV